MFPPDYVIFRLSGNYITAEGFHHVPRKGEKVDLGGGTIYEVVDVTTEVGGQGVVRVVVDLG
jgi:hypothetical protein